MIKRNVDEKFSAVSYYIAIDLVGFGTGFLPIRTVLLLKINLSLVVLDAVAFVVLPQQLLSIGRPDLNNVSGILLKLAPVVDIRWRVGQLY